tara:strand:+ start:1025 stop:1837 length:813 start_codon:yes stop_codon:yes gene_type:complete
MNLDKHTWENSNTLKGCFISTAERFPENKIRSDLFLSKYKFLGHKLKKGTEYIYGDIKGLDKFKDSKILVVAGGPSTMDCDWDHSQYDFIFSCNHFYKCPKLKNVKVDLTMLVGGELDISDSQFLKYCKNYKPYFAVEDWGGSIDKIKHLDNLINNRVFECVCRFQAKCCGVGPKVVILALVLGAKQVDFVGIDGISKEHNPEKPLSHSFEKPKVWHSGKMKNRIYSYSRLLRHYETLAEYFKQVFPDRIINNLGAGHKHNCLSKYELLS